MTASQSISELDECIRIAYPTYSGSICFNVLPVINMERNSDAQKILKLAYLYALLATFLK